MPSNGVGLSGAYVGLTSAAVQEEGFMMRLRTVVSMCAEVRDAFKEVLVDDAPNEDNYQQFVEVRATAAPNLLETQKKRRGDGGVHKSNAALCDTTVIFRWSINNENFKGDPAIWHVQKFAERQGKKVYLINVGSEPRRLAYDPISCLIAAGMLRMHLLTTGCRTLHVMVLDKFPLDLLDPIVNAAMQPWPSVDSPVFSSSASTTPVSTSH